MPTGCRVCGQPLPEAEAALGRTRCRACTASRRGAPLEQAVDPRREVATPSVNPTCSACGRELTASEQTFGVARCSQCAELRTPSVASEPRRVAHVHRPTLGERESYGWAPWLVGIGLMLFAASLVVGTISLLASGEPAPVLGTLLVAGVAGWLGWWIFSRRPH